MRTLPALALVPAAACMAACICACSGAHATPRVDEVALLGATDALRADGPAAFAELLARYDAAPPGRVRDALAVAVDAVGGQRYATVSRLYWYTDLTAAEAEAARRHVPILSLRLLGRLDEDRSCANSRLFRATLYADRETSAFLRDHFVLHWSSERPVPHVTIDFGDGRRIETTTTGNSIHYVLDERGRVLDALPGLYAPVAFRRELAASLELADRVRGATDDAVAAAVADYHVDVAAHANERLRELADLIVPVRLHRLAAASDLPDGLGLAQGLSLGKAAVEAPALRQFGYLVKGTPDDVVAAWAAAGQALYGIGAQAGGSAPSAAAGAPHVLDAQALALMARLHDGDLPPALRSSPATWRAVVDRLEEHAVADSAQNQLSVRPRISRWIAAHAGRARFAELNAWVYAEAFATPRTDAWLGLLPRSDFTGLPGDGVRVR